MLQRLITAIQSSRRSAQACLAQYPKQFAGLFAALLLGGVGATYALAAFAPDPAEQTIRQVVESIAMPELVGSANLDAPALNLYRSDLTRASDTADSLLRRLGVDDPSAAQFLRY
ncbi:MAG: M23 family peptidase, partial [Burkholderiales bacterium]|nr:M23 family peptidase [Burkholderiales bacterium]